MHKCYSFILIGVLTLLHSYTFAQNDFEAPVLSSFTVSPSTVDISSGAVSITASIRATDASGVITPTSSGAYVYYQGNYVYGSTWTLIDGDRFDGTYKSTIVIDETFGPSGEYSVNERYNRFADPGGYQGNNVNNAELTVINNSNADFEAPVLSSFTVSPSTVDISSGAVSITASIRATDASGVITPTSSGAYVYYQGNYVYGSTWTLIDGDRFDGTYESTIVIDETFGPSGEYSVNERYNRFADPGGYQGNNVNNAELTVINNSNADFEAPVLSSFTVSPSTVDISSGAVSITASIRATDASGVITPTSSGAYVYYQGNYVYGSTWTLIDGDRFDGTYESTIVIDETFGPSGEYSVNERYNEIR